VALREQLDHKEQLETTDLMETMEQLVQQARAVLLALLDHKVLLGQLER
tara:strand:- start:126 stop:272 length:147 start_codon:yes stop_codon:yes gene_type:complete